MTNKYSCLYPSNAGNNYVRRLDLPAFSLIKDCLQLIWIDYLPGGIVREKVTPL
jgi:hypothetical protein